MDISAIIVARNEEANIKDCLNAMLAQDYTGGQFEVVVVDGMSDDRTTEIVREMAEKHSNLRLAYNEKLLIAPGRNIGLAESKFGFIAFTDADCIVPNDWLAKLAGGFETINKNRSNLGAVGGGNISPKSNSVFAEALGIYLDSFLGSFNSPQGRLYKRIKEVASLPCLNVLYNKEAVISVGGFDESLGNVAEDLDMNIRMRKAGYSLYFLPEATVIHKLRPNLSRWLRNMVLYGKGRAIITKKHGLYKELFFIMPMAYCISMILSPLGFIWNLFFLPLLYFPLMFLYCLFLCFKKGRLGVYPYVYAIFLSTHAAYAFSLLINFTVKSFMKHE